MTMKKAKRRVGRKEKVKRAAMEVVVYGSPVWFCILMLIHWIIFGY